MKSQSQKTVLPATDKNIRFCIYRHCHKVKILRISNSILKHSLFLLIFPLLSHAFKKTTLFLNSGSENGIVLKKQAVFLNALPCAEAEWCGLSGNLRRDFFNSRIRESQLYGARGFSGVREKGTGKGDYYE